VAPGQNPSWVYDAEVTEVGKNAERSRQFLFWVLSHPAVNTAPVFVKLWGITRNIAIVFVVLVIVAFGIGLILSRRAGSIGPILGGNSSPFLGANIPRIFLKLISILLYIMFSYILVLGVIQVGEVAMRFIKSLGGEELFNVIFAGSGNVEANYTNFVGFKDANPNSLEMVRTSLTLIRLTSLTYNIMAVLLILRTVILWFMLVLAPFIALLLPFVLIKNTAYIWIGVFFQWLFYGPLMLLFLVSLTNIWSAGIPYSFNFSRVNTPGGQVYHTAINILYGGPAQTLSAANSANYVDTYAEYMISLVMLWAAILLPWLLLRIFRDYCCELIASGNAKLGAILDRFRQFPAPSPPSPSLPGSKAGMAAELPFRNRMQERIKEVTHVTQHTKIEEIRDITNTSTNEITRKMDLSVSSLKDVSRLEMNQSRRSAIEDQLRKITSPEQVSSPSSRQQFSRIKDELEKRAAGGDRQAATLLAAGENKTEKLVAQALEVEGVNRPTVASSRYTKQGMRPTASFAPTSAVHSESGKTTKVSAGQIAQSVHIEESKVSQALTLLSQEKMVTAQVIDSVVAKTQISAEKVKEIVVAAGLPAVLSVTSISQTTQIPESKVKEIIELITAIGVVTQQSIVTIAQNTNLPVEKISAVLHEAKVPIISSKTAPTVTVEDYEEVKSMWLTHYRNAPVPLSETIQDRFQWLGEEEKKLTNISQLLESHDQKLKQKGLEQVADILPFMLLGNFTSAEMNAYIRAKLEADRQVRQEEEIQAKVKRQTLEEVKEEQETLLTVDDHKKKEEQKHLAVEQENEIPEKGTK
jgi:hypothetical protein